MYLTVLKTNEEYTFRVSDSDLIVHAPNSMDVENHADCPVFSRGIENSTIEEAMGILNDSMGDAAINVQLKPSHESVPIDDPQLQQFLSQPKFIFHAMGRSDKARSLRAMIKAYGLDDLLDVGEQQASLSVESSQSASSRKESETALK
jgi:hypothetical protein